MSWKIENNIAENLEKKFRQKYPREYASLLDNVVIVVGLLNRERPFVEILRSVSFLRSEGNQIYRIGQTLVISSKESRMYIAFDFDKRILRILGLGTKETQARDIANAKRLWNAIAREGSSNDG